MSLLPDGAGKLQLNQDAVNKAVILIMVLAISALFLTMIAQFLMTLFLAGIFSALARPLFLRFEGWFGGRRHLASLATLLLIALVLLLPLALLASILVGQALEISQVMTVWIRGFMDEPGMLTLYFERLPFFDQIMAHREQITGFAGDVASAASKLMVAWLSSATLSTVNLVFLTFVLLYSMFFLQMDGPKLLERILYYLPLKTAEERVMLEKFTSVTRATLKGTVLIGLLQGGLAGIAFAVVGVDKAVFWGTVMAILSIIPNVGSALVWIPAALILASNGHLGAGLGLALFCGLLVGNLDNVLRPILVGKDTRLHELMIFFGTLGGIFMFGLPGIIIGPLIASLFVSMWELYGLEFADVLPDVDLVIHGAPEEARPGLDAAAELAPEQSPEVFPEGGDEPDVAEPQRPFDELR